MTGEVERLKTEEAQAALEKKRAAESLMEEVHRSNAEQVALLLLLPCHWLKNTELAADSVHILVCHMSLRWLLSTDW